MGLTLGGMGLGFATLIILAGLIVALVGDDTTGWTITAAGVLLGALALLLHAHRHRTGRLLGSERLHQPHTQETDR